MKVAGFGMRASATAHGFAELWQAGGITHIAVLRSKADHPAFTAFAATTGLPVVAVGDVSGIDTPTVSPRIAAQFGTGSVAEAVAVAAIGQMVGQSAQITTARRVTQDGTVTMAIAEAVR